MERKREALAATYIADALLLLMKTEYKDISITEICRKAGVTRMSFYRNLESREDILRHWIEGVTERFFVSSGISFKKDSSREYFTKLFTHMKKYREICLLLRNSGMLYIVKEQFDRVFLEIHKDEYDDYKSYFLAGGIYNIFLLWLVNGCRESPGELAARLEDLLVK